MKKQIAAYVARCDTCCRVKAIHMKLSTKAGRQSTLGYTHGSSLSVDGVQATNLMVTQDTDKLFIQVRSPCGCNTYVLRQIILDRENNVS